MEIVLGHLSDLMSQAADFLPRLVVAILAFLVSLLIARVSARAVVRAATKADKAVKTLLYRLVALTIAAIGAVFALAQIGIDVTGLVAGLGLAGIILGFALQDIVKNLTAGILLLVQQPFKIGDAIEIGGYAGTVTEIDIRATSLKGWDGLQVIIPNADVYTSYITNYSAFAARRGQLTVAVGYEEELPTAVDAFLEAVRGVQGVLTDPAPAVYCSDLGASGVQVDTYFWIDQNESNMFEVTSQAVMAIKATAATKGIDLPYPIQTIRLRQMPQMEPQ
jgi:small conductance mechanosensitive channel